SAMSSLVEAPQCLPSVHLAISIEDQVRQRSARLRRHARHRVNRHRWRRHPSIDSLVKTKPSVNSTIAISIKMCDTPRMVKNASAILIALQKATIGERAAVEFFEQHRWEGAPACPRCGAVDVYQMASATGERNKDYRWRCRGCKQMFTVRTGTIFEESRLPMRVWAFAMWRAAASKKGCSALELSREMQITHKSALFVLRRIRHGLGANANAPKLTGTIEADETYVGGRPRRFFGYQHKHKT